MQCAECGFDNRASAKFCGECGIALAEQCRQCGHRNRPRARFCDSCGTAVGEAETPGGGLKPEAERRQLTVMFCDLVGSTELSSRLDPEDLREVMRAYQDSCAQAIQRFDGHIAQTLGDGLMVYFGYPRAHEDDAGRAVRAGLAIVDAIRALDTRLRAEREVAVAVRIGIHTGLVVVGELGGHDTRADMAVVGETPNVAARLQGLAEPNTVLLGAPTRRLAGDVFAYDDLGARPLKGVAEPLALYRVTGERSAESRFAATHRGGITPLVGRDEEVGLLMGRWREACEGDGQVVLLCGEPGIGKSRIADTVRERLSEPHSRLQYQCSPFHTNSAFYPIIAQLEHAAGFATDDETDTKLDKLETVLAGDDAESRALLASLLSLPTDRYPALNLSPQRQKERTIEVLGARLAALSRQRPLLFVWEDAHWIDPTSLEALDRVIAAVAALPVLAIVTFRPELVPQWGAHSHVTLHTLNRLGRRQSAALAARVAEAPLPEALVEQITAKTDGVPLFIEELTKTVLESDLVVETQDGYALSGAVDAMTIPATLHDSLMARLDRLIPVKEVAQIGAAIGREFSHQLLAALSSMSTADLDAAIDKLLASELVHRRGTPPEATYVFKHALVQDAAYESLLKRDRQDLHRQIAEALFANFPMIAETEPEVLAQHFTKAGLLEKAIPHWLRAGEIALDSFALPEAVAHLVSGADLLADLQPSTERDRFELDILSTLGNAYLGLKGWASKEIDTVFSRTLTLSTRLGDESRLLISYFYLWTYFVTRADFKNSKLHFEKLIEKSEKKKRSDFYIVGNWCASIDCLFRGDNVGSISHYNNVMENYTVAEHGHLVQKLNPDPKTGTLVWGNQTLWILGYPDQARRALHDLYDHVQSLGHPLNTAFALSAGCAPFVFLRQRYPAVDWLDEALKIGREQGFPLIEQIFQPFFSGALRIALGETKMGLDTAQRGIRAWEATGGLAVVPIGKAYVAMALGMVGQTDDALEVIDDILRHMADTGERMVEAEARRIKGEILLAHSEAAAGDAETEFLEAVETARRQNAKSWELRAASSLARLWQSQGKRREARDLLAPVYDWFTEGFDTADLKEAKALLTELE